MTGAALAPADGSPRASAFERLVSDDLRAPLNSILALAAMLEREPQAIDGAAYIRGIADHGRDLLRLVADAEDVARAVRGELPLAPEPVRLRDVLDAVQAEWMPRALADGVGLGAFYDGDPALHAELDRRRLQQVYGALVSEALRFTRRGGVEIGLKAVPDGARVVLHGHVRDTGPRPAPAALAALFEDGPSPLPPEASARRPELAHSLCRALLDALGGRIWAETNPGSGMVVRFSFETAACQLGGAQAEEDAPPLSGRILIVDDNATNRMVAQTLVEMFGCSCETASDGVEAVEAARRGRFDAVLMDIRMPRMDGMEAARAIHALPGRAAGVPVIALTANSGADEAKAYRAAGMCDVVEKPIKADRLLAALGAALGGKASSRLGAAA